ncbi:MAG TPA: hypothetical protein VEJ86_00885 [Candidatus Binataceae bacterium]|nr:hypothetical protein [Candidatus Binataceae bacterium]
MTDAAQLSDAAFGLLGSVNSNPSPATALLGPVANLASDAQALSTALKHGDSQTASHALTSVIADRTAIDAATANGSPLPDGAGWDSIKKQIATLERQIKPASEPLRSDAPTLASEAPTAPEVGPVESVSAPPQVVISSRVFTSGAVRVKGFIAGTDLDTAGIYDNGQLLKPVDVSGTPGEQRINFDFTIEDPTPSQTIETKDHLGRVASEQIAPDAAIVPRSDDDHEKMVDLGSGVVDDSTSESGRNVEPENAPGPGKNTAEIPRYGNPAASSSDEERIPGGAGGSLTNVQINVLGVTAVSGVDGNYRVVGQIVGGNIHRAGVYVDGRLAKPIPISAGGYTAFDTAFAMTGKDATIRVYGAGNNFIESNIDTDFASDDDVVNVPNATPMWGARPYGANPYAPGGYPNPCPAGYGMTSSGCQKLAAPSGPGSWLNKFMP